MSTDLLIRWTSESGAAVRDIARVNRALGQTATTSDKMKAGLAQAATVSKVALAAVATGAVYAGKKAVEQQKAFKGLSVVFKQQAGVMEQWASQQAKIGLSATQAATSAAKLGSSLQGSGLNARQSADATQQLVAIAGDLGAVFGDTAGATEALGAALRGEFDPLEAYGIALKQSDINARLAAKGQEDLTGAALKQASAMAALELITEQSARTRGAATGTDQTAAQQMEVLKATVDNLAASMGTALLPAVQAATEKMQGLADWVSANQGFATKLIVGVTTLAAAIVTLNAITKSAAAIQKAWGLAVAALSNPIGLTIASVIALGVAYNWVNQQANKSSGAMKVLWTVIGQGRNYINPVQAGVNVLTAAIQRLMNYAFTAAKWVSNLWSSFTGYSVMNSVAAAANSVANAIRGIVSAIGSVLSAWSNLVGRLSSGLPSVNLPFAAAAAAPAYTGPATFGASPVARTATTRTATPVVININGFGGDPDTLARRITSVMGRADRRYNRVGLAR